MSYNAAAYWVKKQPFAQTIDSAKHPAGW